MKLVRYGTPRAERPGLLDTEGRIRDLSGIVPDISATTLSPSFLSQLSHATSTQELPVVRDVARLGPCIGDVGKIVCVGLNYRDHIREVGAAEPSEPVLFMKASTALCGPYDDVVIPPGATAVDWEVELGVVIGCTARRVSVEDALTYVAGYCVVNDVSERNWQLAGSGQWVKGKSADTFAPVGPWLVTREEIPDPQNLALRLRVNGDQQQAGNTRNMLFAVSHLVSYVSRFMTLMPGDLISTGTPPGIGMGQRPPRYLRAGDVMELSIDGLGTQRQRVVAAEH